MKKLIISAGIACAGAVGVQGALAPGLSSVEASKPWSVSLSLRGFYDDNYTTIPNGIDTFGIAVSPSASYNWMMEQTTASLKYRYTLKSYFESNTEDQTHEIDGGLGHAFTPTTRVDLSNSFAVAQEPQVLEGSGGLAFFQRAEGDNMRNRFRIDLNTGLTENFGLMTGYRHRWFDYDMEAADIMSAGNPAGVGSFSALLDRVEHRGVVNLRWLALPKTVGIVGYEYGNVHYTSDDPLFGGVSPDDRDNQSHYFYVGAEQTFNQMLVGSAQVGAIYREYDDVNDTSNWGPYANASLTYTYNPGSYIQAGVKHEFLTTDVSVSSATGTPTLDQESTTLFGSLNHAITAKLSLNLIGQLQFSSFNGGPATVDGADDNFYLLGVNLAYEINRCFGAEAGYNYDELDSDLGGRSFDRNRYYIGLNAKF